MWLNGHYARRCTMYCIGVFLRRPPRISEWNISAIPSQAFMWVSDSTFRLREICKEDLEEYVHRFLWRGDIKWQWVPWSKGAVKSDKKAVLSQRWPRDAPYMWVPFVSLHRVRLELSSTGFFVRFLVSPKCAHIPLRVGQWLLGYEERRCGANCLCNIISFQDFQPMWS